VLKYIGERWTKWCYSNYNSIVLGVVIIVNGFPYRLFVHPLCPFPASLAILKPATILNSHPYCTFKSRCDNSVTQIPDQELRLCD